MINLKKWYCLFIAQIGGRLYANDPEVVADDPHRHLHTAVKKNLPKDDSVPPLGSWTLYISDPESIIANCFRRLFRDWLVAEASSRLFFWFPI